MVKRFFIACAVSLASMAFAEVKPVAGMKAVGSSVHDGNDAANAVDGVISDASRWIAAAGPEGGSWLELRLPERMKLGGIHLYSGYKQDSAIEDFHLEFRDASGQWVKIPSAPVTGNKAPGLALPFDDTVEVTTDRLRLNVTRTPNGMARVKEIMVWPGPDDIPALSALAAGPSPQEAIVPLYLNQSGFNLGKPKRFTAPTLDDGTHFAVRPAAGGEALFTGTLTGHIGDFTDFNPSEDSEYVVEAGGLMSVPFRIGLWWLERVSYQDSIDFMIDSRHYVGNYTRPCGGSFGWRDDHHFAWVLHTLVPQYLSNPAAYERMPMPTTRAPNTICSPSRPASETPREPTLPVFRYNRIC